jgi:pyruvate-formate lyase
MEINGKEYKGTDFISMPVSDRMWDMRQRIRNRTIVADAENAEIATEADKELGSMLPYMKHSKRMKAMLSKRKCRVEDFEMLVCNFGREFCGNSQNPFWGAGWGPIMGVMSGRWTLRDDGYYHNPDDAEAHLACRKDDYDKFVELGEYWKGKGMNDVIDPVMPEGYKELKRVGGNPCGDYPTIMLPAGHHTPGYQHLVNTGYGAIRKQAQDWLDAHYNDLMGEDTDKWMFYNGVVDICDGMIALTHHYAEACEAKAAETTDPDRKAELLDMAESLHWVAEHPARHYREAANMVLIYIQEIFLDGNGDIGSCGRFDQYCWPFLKKDLEDGTLTVEQAQEITDCFFLKIGSFWGGGEGPMTQIVGVGNTYMHTTVGGVDPKTGEDSSNPLTYMVLASVGRMKLHDPTISLRVNKNTPDDLWDTAIRVNKMVGGLPLFQNDEEIIPGIQRELGFELEDARDYAIIGCQEITGSGNDYACCNGIIPPNTNLHYAALLTMALNDGKNPYNGEQGSLHTGFLYDMKSIDEVKQAWYDMANYQLRGVMSMNNLCEYVFQHYSPFIGISMFTTGCMESGKDVTWGGAKYNEYGGTATGLATVADSLTAIRYMCFDHDYCTTREMYDACMDNWVGHEELQARIIKEVPHFGNADPYADEMMDWVTNAYYEMCKGIYSKRAKTFRAGLYGASDHVAQGYVTWGTPDGRQNPDPIADGASPCQGRDHNGPTAVLTSAEQYQHNKFMDGMALNIRVHPSALSRQDGIDKMRDMTKTYLDNGGMEVQYNVVSTEDMKAAQANPEEYRDLVVRIAGYSAYFVELSTDQQNDLISRTENSL